MFTWMTAFCAGVIILYCSGFLLPWYAYILFLLPLLCIPHISLRNTSLLLAVFFMLGHAYASFVASQHIGSILPLDIENKRLKIKGYFCSLTREGLRNDTAEFCTASSVSNKEALANVRIILRWPKEFSSSLNNSLANYHLEVKLQRPRGTYNPVGSHYEQYVFKKRIVATGKINSIISAETTLSFSISRFVTQRIVYARKNISEYLSAQFVGLEHSGLLKALLLGDRSDINKTDNDVLSRTGTQHLMAISGLHVGVVLMLLYRLLPKYRRSIVVIALIGLFYVALVGFSASAQRAWVMCVVGIVYLVGAKRPSLSKPFILSLTAVLLLDPLAPLGLGFWYSFLSVGLLLLLAFFGPKNTSPWRLLFVVQLVLLVGLAPINLHYGLPHSVSNSLANLIAIPWVAVVVLPGALLGMFISVFFPALSNIIFVSLNEVLHVLMTFMSSLQSVAVPLKSDNTYVSSLLVYLALLLGLIFFRVKALLMCLVFSLVLYLYLPSIMKTERNELLVFDAGQGLAIGARTGQSVWLYDTGASYERSSVAQRTILPYLYANNLIDGVTGLIVSHGDWDHAGGSSDILDVAEVEYFWSGEVERLAEITKKKPEPCIEGMYWASNSVTIEVLYPFKEAITSNRKSSNNHSCVVRVTMGGVRFLLMGDLEAEAELELVKYYRGLLKSDVLLAGHHGSKNASSFALLKHVQPKFVVFSAGYSNHFGHPHAEVINRVEHYTQNVLNTALTGAITFKIVPSTELKKVDTVISTTVMRGDDLPFWILKSKLK